jgi:hypothetical protein
MLRINALDADCGLLVVTAEAERIRREKKS